LSSHPLSSSNARVAAATVPLIALRLWASFVPLLIATGVMHVNGADRTRLPSPYVAAGWAARFVALAQVHWNFALALALGVALRAFTGGHPRARGVLAALAVATLAEGLLRLACVPLLLSFAPGLFAGPFGTTSLDDACCCLPLSGMLGLGLLVALGTATRAAPGRRIR
jgi:hypothetical protein